MASILVRWTPLSLKRVRGYSSSSTLSHQIVIIGAGTAGTTIAAQLRNLHPALDVAIVDPATTHHYQPGWTLAGTGLRPLSDMRRPMESVIPHGVTRYMAEVEGFEPEQNRVRIAGGVVGYEYLVVVPGLRVDLAAVDGLEDALQRKDSSVTTIYKEQSVERTWDLIQGFKGGKALFTQPAGIIKCAGAPQKVLWMALSEWARRGIQGVEATFATGGASMFAVQKYSQALEKLRVERGVEGLFQHDLVKVNADTKVATFKNLADGGKLVDREFALLHAVPPQKPWAVVAQSKLADSAGWVDVDKSTTRHVRFPNVFSAGDASSLPNSKTAAAIAAQAPVLVRNLATAIASPSAELPAAYDGYASCPLLTGHGELMLAEFKYGGVPKETFARWTGGQETPRRVFYHLKKDFFPWVYWNAFIKGKWAGPRGFTADPTAREEGV